VLDEPFTGIDVDAMPGVMDVVRERIVGRTVLLITHDVADAAALGARLVRMPRVERSSRIP
jgi:ABC-type nitrate/sulfonate/bicarbonate transport system ATPase subunit